MPRISTQPTWWRDPRVPNWGKLLYRNIRGGLIKAFKHDQLKNHPNHIKMHIYRPLMRLPLMRQMNWVKHHLQKNAVYAFGKQGEGYTRRVMRFLYSYWHPYQQGTHILGRRGPVMPIRITGFTSHGEEYWRLKGRPRNESFHYDSKQYKMPITQAKEILNIGTHNFYPRIVDRNFARIFLANQVSNGGSWYLVSRIYCAKKVLDRDLVRLGIRDPPHLRADESAFKQQATAFRQMTSEAEDAYGVPKYNPIHSTNRATQKTWENDQARAEWGQANWSQERRTSVNRRKSSIDPRHGSKYGFSTSATTTTTPGLTHMQYQNGAGEHTTVRLLHSTMTHRFGNTGVSRTATTRRAPLQQTQRRVYGLSSAQYQRGILADILEQCEARFGVEFGSNWAATTTPKTTTTHPTSQTQRLPKPSPAMFARRNNNEERSVKQWY